MGFLLRTAVRSATKCNANQLSLIHNKLVFLHLILFLLSFFSFLSTPSPLLPARVLVDAEGSNCDFEI